ncbi:329_t:CDS:1, partial [Scutellospora calospora]
EYALCVLFNSSKNIFISLCHEILGADYNGKYQVTGGKVDSIDRKQKDYFLVCARHEALEESGIILGDDNLIHVVTEENSRIFPKRETEDVYRTAVYIADIEDVVPQCIEPEKNSEWCSVDFTEMRRLRNERSLTETLGTKLEEIIAHINNYLKAKKRRQPKKKKLIEEKDNSENNSESPKEIVNEVTENCDVMNCDSVNCDNINNNSINHTTEEEIEDEILNIVQ